MPLAEQRRFDNADEASRAGRMTLGLLQRARVAYRSGVTQLLGRGSEPRSQPEKPNQQKRKSRS